MALLVVVPFCLVAAWWQLQRARSGNFLSWAYTFEWPVFAIVAGIMWWQLVHRGWGPPQDGSAADAAAEASAPNRPRPRDREREDAALRSYNDQLEFMAAFGRRKTWRNPKGLP